MKVSIVDYGAGNLASVVNAFHRIGAETTIATTPEAILDADRIVLPGVGASGEALTKLRERHLEEALNEAVRRRGRPMLGICLGMQMLAETLHEFGSHKGLGWIPGTVVPLQDLHLNAGRIPHMGWNQITTHASAGALFEAVRGDGSFYFSHSYAMTVTDPQVLAATCDYGGTITAAVLTGSAFAVQFHPEKSQLNGEKLLTAFLEWAP